jgi:HD-GYP domain-containing protein (c-di-GMP phosphodiesterase class II)
MLKRIKPQDIRLGMFVEVIEGSRLSHPFWGRRLLLTQQRDVATLKQSGVEIIVIDTSKGVDVVGAMSDRRVAPASDDELQRARRTIEQSKPLIKNMFENARMGTVISVEGANEAVRQIAACMKVSATALLALTRLKSHDEYTFLHSIAVCALMVHLGRASDLDEAAVHLLGMGGLVHDIGKARINPAVLNKSGALDDREKRHIRSHPAIGHKLLVQQNGVPDVVLDICLHHHERIDGKGYPNGLSGEEISLPARICSICDVYDALTSVRAYKKAWTPLDAARFMLETNGQFDRRLLMRLFYSLDFRAVEAPCHTTSSAD